MDQQFMYDWSQGGPPPAQQAHQFAAQLSGLPQAGLQQSHPAPPNMTPSAAQMAANYSLQQQQQQQQQRMQQQQQLHPQHPSHPQHPQHAQHQQLLAQQQAALQQHQQQMQQHAYQTQMAQQQGRWGGAPATAAPMFNPAMAAMQQQLAAGMAVSQAGMQVPPGMNRPQGGQNGS
jgi:hypothetical protein